MKNTTLTIIAIALIATAVYAALSALSEYGKSRPVITKKVLRDTIPIDTTFAGVPYHSEIKPSDTDINKKTRHLHNED